MSPERLRYPWWQARLVGGPAGLRRHLERLGPTFVQIGQFLALRPDVVPLDYGRELMHLLNQAPPAGWDHVEATISQTAGKDAHHFQQVDRRPIAVNYFAQTHVARLRDGTMVALKVKRPDIDDQVLRDLRRARLIARAAESLGIAPAISPKAIMEELTWSMTRELDFEHELQNLIRLHRLSETSPYECIPKPYPELSGPSMLVSEFVQGIPFSEILASLRSGDPAQVRRLDELGIDRDALAETLISAVLTQVFVYQFFLANVHPGNLLAVPDGRVGFIDFALCASVDDELREHQLDYLAAAYTGDVEEMFEALLDVLEPGKETDIPGFRRDFAAQTKTWISRLLMTDPERGGGPTSNGGRPNVDPRLDSVDAAELEGWATERSPMARWIIATIETVDRHGLKLPPRVLTLHRVLLSAESVADQLGGRTNLRSVGRRFLTRVRVEKEIRALGPEHLEQSALSILSMLRRGPRQVERILSDLSAGRLSVNVYTTETPATAGARRRRSRLLAAAILTIAPALVVTLPDPPDLLGVPLDSVAWGALACLYLVVALQWRQLR